MSAGGGGDEALYDEVEQLLREHEALRDGQCAPGSHDWEDLQSRSSHLMVFLAYIATAQGRPGQAEEWFTRAAAGWQALGDQAWADEARVGAAEAALAGGTDADLILETLDSWLSDRASVRKAALLASAARTLLDAGEQMAARQRASEAAVLLTAAGFIDPVAAGSAEDAFTAWLSSGHREMMPGLPWLQMPTLLSSVALTWVKLIGVRFPLDGAPVTQRLPLTEGLHALGHRLTREAVDAGNEAQVAAGGPGATWPATR